jgi:hypothetical protein
VAMGTGKGRACECELGNHENWGAELQKSHLYQQKEKESWQRLLPLLPSPWHRTLDCKTGSPRRGTEKIVSRRNHTVVQTYTLNSVLKLTNQILLLY